MTKQNKEITIQEGESMESALIEIVKRKDIDPDRLEKFLELQIKMEDRQAKKNFYDALAGFQQDCPVIPKNKNVNFKSVDYNYAPLDEIVRIIKKPMGKYRLAFSFNTKSKSEKIGLLLTKITHGDGHSEISEIEYDIIHDDQRMNNSQRRKSSITYMKRAGLENALGIVTANEDDDAQGANDQGISKDQIILIEGLIPQANTTQVKFLKYLKVENFEDLSCYEAKKAINALKGKRDANL